MSAAVAIAAFPVAALVLWTLLRTALGARLGGGRLVAMPSGERWHQNATPSFGGVGIFLGFAAGILLAIAVGAVDASSELLGVLAGCTLLFAAGLADDLFTLSPVAKLGAQFGAAAIVLASGLSVEIVDNDILATTIALVWLVGITNAFNLLDNMDGLAATLAAIACAYYALDAVTEHPNTRRTRARARARRGLRRLPPVQPAAGPCGRRLHGRLRAARCSASRSPRLRSPRAGRSRARP